MLPMCQLNVKVTIEGQISNNQILDLCRVRSVSPTLIERFSLILSQKFTSTRGYAEPMMPLRLLKVEVTLEGQNWPENVLQF